MGGDWPWDSIPDSTNFGIYSAIGSHGAHGRKAGELGRYGKNICRYEAVLMPAVSLSPTNLSRHSTWLKCYEF